MTKTLYMILMVALLISACQPLTTTTHRQTNNTPGEILLVTPEQLETYLTEKSARQTTSARLPYMSARPLTDSAFATGESTKNSQTNVQVQGIDEADIVKTYQDYIIVASGQVITAIAKNATTLYTLTNLTSDQYYTIQSLLISNQTLTVILTQYGVDGTNTTIQQYSLGQQIPQFTQSYVLPGYFVQARLLNDSVYIITHQYEYDIHYPWPIFYKGTSPIQAQDVRIMPHTIEQETSFTHIAKITQQDFQTTSIVSQNQPIVYMDTQGLILAYNQYTSIWEMQEKNRLSILESHLTSDDSQLISEINQVSSEILSAGEKQWKISAVYTKAYQRLDEQTQGDVDEKIKEVTLKQISTIESLSTTTIVKMSLDLSQTYTQQIPGSVYGQFAIDWSKESYKIATTQQAEWYFDTHKEETNNLFILDATLQKVSEIRNIASNESIYSVRYTPDYAYIVTYKQIDPLFVIDISDQTNPQIIGELKIPGFSRYMHIINDSYIIGIGQEDWSTLQISLFDVSQKSNPKKVNSIEIKNAYSSALYEHKAITVFDNMFALPISTNTVMSEKPYAQYKQSYELVLVSIDETLKKIGQVSHTTMIERSATVDDSLFTIGYTAVRVHNKTTLKPIGDVLIGFVEQSGFEYPVERIIE
jgi:inhibitor of cysteine peptidase